MITDQEPNPGHQWGIKSEEEKKTPKYPNLRKYTQNTKYLNSLEISIIHICQRNQQNQTILRKYIELHFINI